VNPQPLQAGVAGQIDIFLLLAGGDEYLRINPGSNGKKSLLPPEKDRTE
jgi:hypothetical protein